MFYGTGISGCFGSPVKNEPIDNLDETVVAVDDILEAGDVGANASDAADGVDAFHASMQVMAEYLKRVRILTWAVVALAVVVIMREVD